jgi:hypothetical protein
VRRRVFRTPPPEIKLDYASLLDWVRYENPKMPMREAQRIAHIQAVRAEAKALKEEGLERMRRED